MRRAPEITAARDTPEWHEQVADHNRWVQECKAAHVESGEYLCPTCGAQLGISNSCVCDKGET